MIFDTNRTARDSERIVDLGDSAMRKLEGIDINAANTMAATYSSRELILGLLDSFRTLSKRLTPLKL